jgi:hypothetical protein
MPQETATPSIGVKLGFKPCDSDDPMTTDWPDVPVEPSEEQERHLEETGRLAFPMRTVGPTAKERERGRLPRTRAISQGRPRARGAGRPAVRGSSRRSSARSGDSGSEDGEPEPPPRRLCAFCGKDIPATKSSRALYCCDQHADRDRQRRKRQRDRERDLRPRTPTTADERRMYEITPEDVERLQAVAACRCNGRHLEFDPGSCFRCGHWLPRGVAA